MSVTSREEQRAQLTVALVGRLSGLEYDQAVINASWAVSCQESLARTCTRSPWLSSSSTPIARAKLKHSQLFERDGTYGIDDAFQN